jgi:GNAT superfamily N-acetyltransferase
MQWQKDEFTISTDNRKMDIPYIHSYLSERSYWAEGIPMETVRASVAGALSFGVYVGEDAGGGEREGADEPGWESMEKHEREKTKGHGWEDTGGGPREKQIGLARVITDKATFAYLADVFIDEDYRGRGLSKWMMEVILSHPELQGLRRWMLATYDAHGLYAQYGFLPLDKPERIMQKLEPDVYRKKAE